MDFLGVGVFYIPGLLLVSLTTFPNLLGPTFNTKVLSAGLLGLMPIGTGFIKSIVNVFGAKQFHPLQSRQVESYYVNFYVAINIGALIGGILVPIIAQQSMEVAI
jgi:POT family proton-dependent oligopeptide transporter